MTSGVDLQADRTQLFIQLIVGSGLVTRDELNDFKTIARDLNMPVLQAIMSSGSIAKENLDLSADALSRIQSKQISPDLAIRALRIAIQQKISMTQAINSAKSLHRTTRIVVSAANDLTSLLLEAGIINRELLGTLLVKASNSSMMIGQMMVLENEISISDLLNGLNCVILIKAGLKRLDAINGLKHAFESKITVEQALFELGTFVQPDAKQVRVGELFLLAGLITKEDFAECLEIELFKNKEFGQILEERGLVSSSQLDSSKELLEAIANELLTPHEAAHVLHLVCRDSRAVYAAIGEIHAKRESANDCKLGDLLVESCVCLRQEIESAATNTKSAVKLGNTLLKSGLVSEHVLYTALRVQTSLRLGFLTRQKALDLLRHCVESNVSLEQAFDDTKIYVPSRMQWAWV